MPVQVGDRIKLVDSSQRGTIAEIRKDKYHIVFGGNIGSWMERNRFVPDQVKTPQKPDDDASKKE
jgi:hypothetical protein